jgi:hypothetical protein
VSTTARLTHRPPGGSRDVTLLELLDRLLANGVVLQADITLSVAEVDLVSIGLRALITAAANLEQPT